MPSRGGFTVTLHRDSTAHPWGIRLVGGCDLGKPIVITKVWKPADKIVKPGDVVLQISDYDARDVRHEDAQMLFKNAGNTIRLVVHRESIGSDGRGTPLSSRGSSVDPLGLPRAISAELPEPLLPTSLNSALMHQNREFAVVSPYRQEIQEEIQAVTDQPYRTTPLVLPGAKVKKEAGPTESYLRHHPNPTFRKAPPHPLLPHDIAMKHKVSHKQFNSPMGLYSEQNIVDTINQQAGTVPSNPSPTLARTNTKLSQKKTVQFDPLKSETYRALQDEEYEHIQEVVPIQPKVFTPVKKAPPPQTNRSVPSHAAHVPHSVPGPVGHQINYVGASNDEIQQSYTFKRLMHMVQNEGGFKV